MTLKKIAIFPIQANNLDIEEIRFVKSLTLFIHLSLESFLYLNSSIVKLISTDGKTVSEDIYISYTKEELLDKYTDSSIDYIILFDVINKKNNHIITYYIYDNPKKELINTKSYILGHDLSEKVYRAMIADILNYTKSNIYLIDTYLSNIDIFNELINIIINDPVFFFDADNIKFIEDIENIYSRYKELSLLRYIVRKILSTNNIFFVNKIIQKLKSTEKDNDYAQFLLATTLMELKQYKEALKILDILKDDSAFLKLRGAIVFTLKAEANLRLNNLSLARTNIMKAIKFNIAIKDTYELFLEIMYKSKFFLAFKSYLSLENFSFIREKSSKASYWIARYYSEISVDNKKALSYIEDFKYNDEIIFLYLKILYRISIEDNNQNKLKNYITDLYKKNILKLEGSKKDNIEFVKMFVIIYINLNKENKLTNIFTKEKTEAEFIPYKENITEFLDIEKIIFNQIYEEMSKESPVIKDLLFFILKDYEMGIKLLKLLENKELYFYTTALVNENKRLKFLKKAFKVNKNINILNKIIIYHSKEENYISLYNSLRKRKKYIKDDFFDKYYTVKKHIIGKNYKLALKLSENLDFLRAEIYFKIKKYDEALEIFKKYNDDTIKDTKLSYMNGYILSIINNNRRGLFYLQNSYNLNPNKILHKELIKEYKKYGIEYSPTPLKE